MLSKCANPSCDARFRYLGDGRLFQVERRNGSSLPPSAHNVEHFWLCARCAATHTLQKAADGSVTVVEQPRPRAA